MKTRTNAPALLCAIALSAAHGAAVEPQEVQAPETPMPRIEGLSWRLPPKFARTSGTWRLSQPTSMPSRPMAQKCCAFGAATGPADCIDKIREVIHANRLPPLYVIIDEYDNFTNEHGKEDNHEHHPSSPRRPNPPNRPRN